MAKKNTSKSSKKTKDDTGKQSAAFHIFFTEQSAHRTELSSISVKEQTKILQAEWKKLSPQEKQNYISKISTESSSHRPQTGVKTKRSTKHQSPTKKKTHAKKMAKKSAHHDHTEACEITDHTHE